MIKKFGIIGNPIKHSLSPILHNYWFKKYKIEANYSIIDVKDESELPDIIAQIRNKEISGINVTLPYKQKIVSHVDTIVNDAETTSSVNTVYLDSKETVIGENTDVFGLQAAYLKEIDNAQKESSYYWRWRCFAICSFIFRSLVYKKYQLLIELEKNVFS